MPFFLRAINRENWPEPEENATVHDLDADALNDLKTQENTMSVWYAETEDDFRAGFVAYLASMDRWMELEAVEFIAINTKYVEEVGIKYDAVPNFTYITEYKELHRDLVGLKYDSIEKIADIVIKSINEGRDYIIDKGQIKEMFKELVEKGKLHSDVVEKSRHGKLRKMIIEIENEINEG